MYNKLHAKRYFRVNISRENTNKNFHAKMTCENINKKFRVTISCEILLFARNNDPKTAYKDHRSLTLMKSVGKKTF